MKTDLNILKSFAFKTALKIFFVAAAAHFMLQYIKIGSDSIKTTSADMEIRRDVVEIYGYIFRNEQVIYSPGGNRVNYLIENGGKAGKSQLIAQASQSGADVLVKSQTDELTLKLDILNKSNINLDFVTVNIDKIDGDSRAMYINMLKSIESGNLGDAGKSKNELLILLNRRQLVSGTGGGFGALIASAGERLRQLELQAAGSGAVGVYSDKSGIFYTIADGYENYFTADALKTLDFDKFGSLMQKSPDGSIISSAIGKVAYDFVWYLVCKTEKSAAFDYTEGKTYDIIYTYSNDKPIPSVLTRRIDSADTNEVILIFEASLIPPDFDFSRKQAIRIVCSEIKGLRVPSEALRVVELDGEKTEGVYIQRGSVVVFRELPAGECLGKFDGYYLYLDPSERPAEGGGTLQLHESVIIAGKNLYDGKIIG